MAVELRSYSPPNRRLGVMPPQTFSPEQTKRIIPRPLTREELITIGDMAYDQLLHVVHPDGIMASKDMRFHHLFGRDTFKSAHFINAADNGGKGELWQRAKSAVFKFWDFQREDGKVRHEVKPFHWGEMQRAKGFYYRMGDFMVNDDSVDATALALIGTPEFIESEDEFRNFIPKAVRALDWMMQSMDKKNGWLSYRYNPHGLTHQGWMDSVFSVREDDGSTTGTLPADPVALVEVQAYAWKAMKVWADLLRDEIPDISRDLAMRADDLKTRFNNQFIIYDEKGTYFVHALDRNGNQVRSISINPGIVLGSSYKGESIIDGKHVSAVVTRLMGDGFFDRYAGIRTFEKGQRVFDPEDERHGGYHNGKGVYWGVATAEVIEGLLAHGYEEEAREVMYANLVPVKHFGSFIEQFSKNAIYSRYRNAGTDGSCNNQTWTMAESLWLAHYLVRNDFHNS